MEKSGPVNIEASIASAAFSCMVMLWIGKRAGSWRTSMFSIRGVDSPDDFVLSELSVPATKEDRFGRERLSHDVFSSLLLLDRAAELTD